MCVDMSIRVDTVSALDRQTDGLSDGGVDNKIKSISMPLDTLDWPVRARPQPCTSSRGLWVARPAVFLLPGTAIIRRFTMRARASALIDRNMRQLLDNAGRALEARSWREPACSAPHRQPIYTADRKRRDRQLQLFATTFVAPNAPKINGIIVHFTVKTPYFSMRVSKHATVQSQKRLRDHWFFCTGTFSIFSGFLF